MLIPVLEYVLIDIGLADSALEPLDLIAGG
jgi:hypothetical protein